MIRSLNLPGSSPPSATGPSLHLLWLQVSQKELKEALRRQWSQLSDKRRLKWISKALELQKDYEVPTGRNHDQLDQTRHHQAWLNQT